MKKIAGIGKDSVIGKKFWYLTAMEFLYKKNGHRYRKYLCICGIRKILLEYNVRNGFTKSCGCFRRYANPNRFSLEFAQKVAKKKNGRCLSVEYVNCETKMLWECNNGHQWSARFNDIKNGGWCPHCAFNAPLTIADAHKIAKDKSGKCLSTEYNNDGAKLLWECNKGHQWEATLPKVKNSTWCPACAKNLKLSIEHCNLVAKERGGKCLSTEYVNCETKMLWECSNGHQWSARFNDIKNGRQWCPGCMTNRRKQTSLKKYGTDHPMKNKNISKKCAKNQANSYTLYHWKTNEELICQASYEKRVVEYFNKNKINFRWQSKIFSMPDGRTYRPDAYLFSTKKWVEIKGYFRKDAKEKWDWFHKEKPNSELWNKEKLKKMGIL